MLETWYFTVVTSIPSAPAIAPYDIPLTRQRSTFISALVNSVLLAVPTSTTGGASGNICSPAMVRRTASIKSSSSVSLYHRLSAPASRARLSTSQSTRDVTTTIFISGWLAFIFSTAARPFSRRSVCTSMSIKSILQASHMSAALSAPGMEDTSS